VNKKKQKKFDDLKRLAPIVTNPTAIRSFLFLFFKKEVLTYVSKPHLSFHATPVHALPSIVNG
jgi:hypothetical protein